MLEHHIKPEDLLSHMWQQYDAIFRTTSREVFAHYEATHEKNEIYVEGWNYFPISSQFELHVRDTCFLLAQYVDNLGKKNLIDLGCGSGKTIGFFSYVFGFPVYGIDVSPHIIHQADETIRRLKEKPEFGHIQSIHAQGNFFPPGYDVSEAIKWFKVPVERRPAIDNDPYQQLEIQLDGFDIFYFYQYQDNTPPALQLIADRAHKGAHIVFADAGNYRDIDLPFNIRLAGERNRVKLFTVV